MKQFGRIFKHIIISSTLVLTSLSLPSSLMAQVDTALEQQKAECAKNSAAEWSLKLNKCVGKVEDRKNRHEAIDCNKISDLTQRAECHKKLAEEKTGLSSDPNSLNQGGLGKSATMNGGIALAYTVLGLINGAADSKKESTCMSKKIFGVTAFAGVASDIFLKIRAKKKVNALKDKYKLDVKQGAFDAQVKALQYLKEEQETVADIASMEKKRNMLLMLGYGAASVMAIYEIAMSTTGGSANCYKKEPEKPQTQATPEKTETQEATKQTTADDKKGASDTKETTGTKEATDRPKETATPVTEERKVEAKADTGAETQKTETKTASADPNKEAKVDHTTRNGKEYYTIKNDPTSGKTSVIVDDKVLDNATGKQIGKVDYSKGVIEYSNGTKANINYSGPKSSIVDYRSPKLKGR